MGHCGLCLLRANAKGRCYVFHYGGGGGGFALQVCDFICELHTMRYGFASIKLCGPDFELCVAGLVLWICGPH